jgi:heterotetrameric sarcosine oxidase delta subunit
LVKPDLSAFGQRTGKGCPTAFPDRFDPTPETLRRTPHMIINHPILGPRDAQEFVYLGDANLINRPDGREASPQVMHDYVYLRTNPAGEHRELWYHEQGDRSWLVVTRNTLTHEIVSVELARDVAREIGRGA